MRWLGFRGVSVCIVLWTWSAAALHAVSWYPLGPYGGDARSFATDASDPRHLYLGTETGWLYESHDAGATWNRVSRIGKRDDLVLDHILIDPKDPKRLIVGTWRIDRPDGGLYISDDGGKTWYEQAQMRGQSVRSMARSLSDPQEIVAGTLQGVFRSKDSGLHWDLISPPGSPEIHEVQSLAIDPSDPQIIYAGTWHLPWKTVDGGENWSNIKQGIIDDSDVFSIIVDPNKPQVVYASACSGIYKSTDAAAQFRKVTGIPSTARRTRKLLQDPNDPETVYAGTTEGLYRTLNGGQTFERMTSGDVIVNDVYVDPKDSKHVLIAIERGGVLSSDDGASTFHSSNTGFSARQVSAYAADTHSDATIYVGVVNDKATGGVFQSHDGGVQWEQQSNGLGGRDVFSLVSTSQGTLLAGTAHGIFRFGEGTWTESGTLAPTGEVLPAPIAPKDPPPSVPVKHAAARPAAMTRVAAGKKTKTAVKPKPGVKTKAALTRGRKPALKSVAMKRVSQVAPAQLRRPAVSLMPGPPAPPSNLDGIVYSLVADGDTVYAGTSAGLMRGTSDGQSWAPVVSLIMPETRFVAAQGSVLLAGTLKRMELSLDGGESWDTVSLPADLTQISSIAVDGLKHLWVGGTEGVFYSPDKGLTWKTLRNLFVNQVDGIFFDAAGHRVLVSSSNSTVTFAANLPDHTVSFWDTGWPLRFVRPIGDHLIGATMFDGMVLQPEMVASPLKQ